MDQGTRNVRQLAILAYGSLLAHPGPWLGSHMTNLIRCLTPFPVEYSGRSGERCGGAPTLVQCADGTAVYAGLIVLNKYDNPEDLSQVRDELGKREGLNSGKSKSIKDDREMQGFRVDAFEVRRRVPVQR